MESSNKHFSQTFTEEIPLDKPLQPEIIDKILFYPYYYERLFHGLLSYFKPNKVDKFSANEAIKKGDMFASHLPDFEKDEFSIFKVEEITSQTDVKSIRFSCVKPSSKTPLKEQEMVLCYKVENEKANFSFNLSYNTSNPVLAGITKTVFKQALKRINYLANDPEKTLNELEFITKLKFNDKVDSHFSKLPFGLGIQFFALTSSASLKKNMFTHAFLKQVIPNFNKIQTQNDILQTGDKLTFTLNNVGFTGKFAEEVELEVKKCSNDMLTLQSTHKVGNFHELGFTFFLRQDEQNSDIAIIDIAIHHNRSNTFGIASGISWGFSLLAKDMVPDPNFMLKLAARIILEGCVRRFSNFIQHLDISIDTNAPLPSNSKENSPG